MTEHKSVYSLEIQGADLVVRGFVNTANAAKSAAEATVAATKQASDATKQAASPAGGDVRLATESRWQEGLRRSGDGIRALGEVTSKVGGQMAQTLTSTAGSALSLASTLGTGGLTAVLAVVSLAASKFQGILDEIDKTEQATAQAAVVRAQREQEWRAKNLEMLSRKKLAVNEDLVFTERAVMLEQEMYVNSLKKESEAQQRRIVELRDGLEARKAAGKSSVDDVIRTNEQINRILESQKAADLKVFSEEGQLRHKSEIYYRDLAKVTQMQANEAEADASQEHYDKLIEIEKNHEIESQHTLAEDAANLVSFTIRKAQVENEYGQKSIERRRKLDDEANASYLAQVATLEKASALYTEAANSDVSREVSRLNRMAAVTNDSSLKVRALRLDAEHQTANDLAALQEREFQYVANETKENADILIAADRAKTEAIIKNRNDETEASVAAMSASRDAQMKAAIGNETYAASQMVLSQATSTLTSQVAKLGDVNRENYRDLFMIGENTPAIAAKMAQGVLAGIAVQATGKAVFETAEAVAAFARYAASHGVDEMELDAGIKHLSSAAIFGSLAGGSAIGAGAIGSTRGKGGLFGLTPEEQKAQNQGASLVGGGASSSSGPSSGRMSTNTGPAVVNVTYVYEAGAVNARNDADLASTVARGTALSRRDGWANLAARGA